MTDGMTGRVVDQEAKRLRWAYIAERYRQGMTPDEIVQSVLATGKGPIEAVRALHYGAGLALADCKVIVDRNLGPERLEAVNQLRDAAEEAMRLSREEDR